MNRSIFPSVATRLSKTIPGIALALFLLTPATGWSCSDYSCDRGGWGGGPLSSFLSSPFVAAFDPAPLTPRLPAPQAPPGMCRWERIVLDGTGRPVLDRFGRPVKEYVTGSCVSPPDY